MSPKINLGGLAPAVIQPPKFPASEQQLGAIGFVDKGAGNAILVAVAGSGKTTTLVEMCKYAKGTVAYAAFNKKIADEIGRKLIDAGAGQNVKAATFHSFGLSAWRKVAPTCQVDGDKLKKLADSLDIPKNLRSFALRLCSLVKQSAFGCEEGSPLLDWLDWMNLVEHHDLQDILTSESGEDNEDTLNLGVEAAQDLIQASIQQNYEVVDFDDMIFAPLYHKVGMWQYDWVMIDEAQDTNTSRRLMAKRMMKPGGRFIAVGDPRQAIYGFTGADADALDLIKDEFNCIELPLSVSYRCPVAVVEHAQRWVPGIQAAPNAPYGSVSTIFDDEFRRIVPAPTDAIICRVTKPLIGLALSYIKRRIPAHVEGRDIGAGLLALVNKWKGVKTAAELTDRLEDYFIDQGRKLVAEGKQAKLAQLEDRISSINVILESVADDASLDEVRRVITSIFKDTDGTALKSITLSTVHKAKGREWDKVYLYGRDAWMPHAFAKQLWEINQEHNLIYVAVTRAKKELVEVFVNSGGMK